jgi:hypothetical protein
MPTNGCCWTWSTVGCGQGDQVEVLPRVMVRTCRFAKVSSKMHFLGKPGQPAAVVMGVPSRTEWTRLQASLSPPGLLPIVGDKRLFIRYDELEAAWDLFTPLLHEIETRKVGLRDSGVEDGGARPVLREGTRVKVVVVRGGGVQKDTGNCWAWQCRAGCGRTGGVWHRCTVALSMVRMAPHRDLYCSVCRISDQVQCRVCELLSLGEMRCCGLDISNSIRTLISPVLPSAVFRICRWHRSCTRTAAADRWAHTTWPPSITSDGATWRTTKRMSKAERS